MENINNVIVDFMVKTFSNPPIYRPMSAPNLATEIDSLVTNFWWDIITNY